MTNRSLRTVFLPPPQHQNAWCVSLRPNKGVECISFLIKHLQSKDVNKADLQSCFVYIHIFLPAIFLCLLAEMCFLAEMCVALPACLQACMHHCSRVLLVVKTPIGVLLTLIHFHFLLTATTIFP